MLYLHKDIQLWSLLVEEWNLTESVSLFTQWNSMSQGRSTVMLMLDLVPLSVSTKSIPWRAQKWGQSLRTEVAFWFFWLLRRECVYPSPPLMCPTNECTPETWNSFSILCYQELGGFPNCKDGLSDWDQAHGNHVFYFVFTSLWCSCTDFWGIDGIDIQPLRFAWEILTGRRALRGALARKALARLALLRTELVRTERKALLRKALARTELVRMAMALVRTVCSRAAWRNQFACAAHFCIRRG